MEFEQAFLLLIDREGNYSNNPNDPGGETKFGISKRSYPSVNIAGLTLADAKAIYLRDFWNVAACPMLPDPLRFQVFDTAVNSGPRQSVALLQRALGVKDDGAVGPKTLAALASNSSTLALTVEFIAARLRFMSNLSDWDHFGRGWARRIAGNLEEAVK